MQDKGRGSLTRPPASHTAPQSGSGLFHRWSEFQLFAVAGGRYQKIQRENHSVSLFRKVAVTGGFPEFHGSQCGGHFLPPGVKSGVSFSSALTAAAILAGQGGGIYNFQKEHHAKRKIKFALQTSPKAHQLVEAMCPWNNCRPQSEGWSVITRTLFKFCVAKQRIKVLEKISSFPRQGVVWCVATRR